MDDRVAGALEFGRNHHARMNPFLTQSNSGLEHLTRRHFFSRCGVGLGSVALASLLSKNLFAADASPLVNPLAPKPPHFPAKAKNVIFLFMAGGPSQLELFDYKPKLIDLNGQPIPQSFIEGKRFAFMGSSHGTKLLGTRRKFEQHGQDGAFVSELFPHTATIVDDISLVKSCQATLFNHAPAKLFMNTGSGQFGRPSMGAWVTYGIGSDSQDLPGFVVLLSGPRGPRGGAVNWGSGVLPSAYQGVPLRSGGVPPVDPPGGPAPPGGGADPRPDDPGGDLSRPPAPRHRGDRRAEPGPAR